MTINNRQGAAMSRRWLLISLSIGFFCLVTSAETVVGHAEQGLQQYSDQRLLEQPESKDVQVTSSNDDNGALQCAEAATCDDCQSKAEQAEDDVDLTSTCEWKASDDNPDEDTCQPVEKGSESKTAADMCPKDTPPENKPPTQAPAKKPDDQIVPSSDEKDALQCAEAITCDDCQSKAEEAEGNADRTGTCEWKASDDNPDEDTCQPVEKGSESKTAADMCPKDTPPENKPPTQAPAKKPDDHIAAPEDDGINVGFIAAFGGLVVCCGVLYKFKSKLSNKVGDGKMGGMGMGGMGGGGKSAKYQEVPTDDDLDEEWGWGDDDDGAGVGAGEVEMSLSTQSKDDSSVHKRRNQSNESPAPTPGQSSFRKTAPSKMAHTHTPIEHIPPPAPKPPVKTNSGGLSLKGPGALGRTASNSKTSIGTTLTRAAPPPPPAPAAVPVLSPPQAPPVVPEPAITAPTTDFGGMPEMKISSLGPKKKVDPPKKAAPPKQPEDDIFASMGLSSTPQFSHSPAPPPKPATTAPSMGGASRWNNMPTTMAPAAGATTNTFAASLNAEAGGGGNSDDWDDDADLDDLLDD